MSQAGWAGAVNYTTSLICEPANGSNSTGPWTSNMVDAAAGKYNAYYAQLATAIIALHPKGKRAIIRPSNEFNGGWFDHSATELVAREYLAPLTRAGIGSLVLGCTHYPLLKPLLQRVLGSDVTLIDSAQETAAELARVLRDTGLAAAGGRPAHRFVVSDDPARFRQVGARFIGERLGAAEVVSLG
jgi:hypothetical protein